MHLHFKIIYAAILIALATVTPFVAADEPTTMPAGNDAEVKAIQKMLVDLDNSVAKTSLQDFRKSFFTENEREATYTDRIAHEAWETGKAQLIVREKWGPEAEIKFSRLVNATTAAEDQSARVEVRQDHATVSWTIEGTEPQPIIKVDGKWLIDSHAMFQKELTANENFDKESNRSFVKLLKQAEADIAGDKFDDADSFVTDFKAKLATPSDEN